jgi:alpha-N-arabinofuranosidase
MKYQNPIIRGFYPDPSICYAEGKFYLVTSSFQYFPGVPLFESTDLVNWTQIGHVLDDLSQVELHQVRSSGGVFAPTIRYHNGRFYMVTNNNSTFKNFYVYTDDIYGKWSQPIEVDQDGIDPSLYFEDGHAYFISNGHDEEDINGVIQCEIDIETGEKLTKSKRIWEGSGGRYLESPHMYKIGNYYYLMAAEGGTEYGHMVTYARSKSVWGPFENYPGNPVLTNRNKAPYLIQGIGHGDLIQNADGNWYMVSLGFRQIHLWQPYHNLGREVFLTPVHFEEDGWFTAGNDGTTDFSYEIPGDFSQERKNLYTFENTRWDLDWCYLRDANPANYRLEENRAVLQGTDITLEEVDSPTLIALRQIDFNMVLSCRVALQDCENAFPDCGTSLPVCGPAEAGITIYMCEDEHYDIAITEDAQGFYAVLKLNIGGIKHIANRIPLASPEATLIVRSDSMTYGFYVTEQGKEHFLGEGRSKYLSSEVSSGFTGVIMGLYAIGSCQGVFTDYRCLYTEIPLK